MMSDDQGLPSGSLFHTHTEAQFSPNIPVIAHIPDITWLLPPIFPICWKLIFPIETLCKSSWYFGVKMVDIPLYLLVIYISI